MTALSIFRYQAAGLFLSLGWGLSLFVHGSDSLLYAIPFVCLAVAFLFLPISFSVRQFYKNPVLVVFLVFICLCGLNVFVTNVPYITYVFAYVVLIFPVIFIVISCAKQPHMFFNSLIWILGPVVVAVAIWALYQFIFLFDMGDPRIHSPMLNPNNLAAVFNIALIVAIGLTIKSPDPLMRTVLSIVAGMFFLGLLVTQSRGGYICGLLCVLPFLFFIPQISRIKMLGVTAVIVAFSVVLLALRQPSTLLEVGSVSTRFSLWSASWQMFVDNAVWGTGLGTYGSIYPIYRLPSDVYSAGYFAHNDPLQFGVEMGFIAPILMYSLAAIIALKTFNVLRDRAVDYSSKVMIVSCFLAMACAFMHAHISFHFFVLPILILMGLLLGYWYILMCPTVSNGRDTFFSKVPFSFFVCIALIWPVRHSVANYQSDKTQQILDANPINLTEAEVSLQRYVGYAIKSDWRIYKLSAQIDLRRLESGVSKYAGSYKKGLASIRQGQAYNPYDPYFDYIEAQVHYVQYKRSTRKVYLHKSISALERCIQKAPRFFDAYEMIARLYANSNRPYRALFVLQQGVFLTPLHNFYNASYLRLLIELKQDLNRINGLGNIQKRIEALEGKSISH